MEESALKVPNEKDRVELQSKPRVKLDFLNAFGAIFSPGNHDVSNAIHFLDDPDTPIIAYPVGRHIGVRNTLTNEMKFIRQSETIKEITAMAMSPNKKFLAVCEKHKNDFSAYITFYDMKNPLYKNVKSHINVCDSTPTNQKQIISISFSNDSKYIACLLDSPDCKAIAWDWYNKNKVIGQFDFAQQQITKITFNPKDNHQVCTSGHNHWKLWRVQENTFKQMTAFAKVKQDHIFKDHAWLDEDRMVACTSEGEIYILENFELKQQIDNSFKSDDIYNISCILPYSKGFFVASDTGTMSLWAKAEENNKSSGKEYYDFIRKWECKGLEGVKITCMAVNPTEEYLSLGCKNNNIGLVHVKSIGLNDDSSKDVKFDLVCRGFHSGPINSMDIATQRPILATCSKEDSTIRLWNYYTNSCELAREYYVLEDMTIREAAKPLISIAMHPSGYYMAASFIDKIRIYHILHDELKHFRNIDMKNCQHMKFSHGGQWFAAADQKQIRVYNSFTLEYLGGIKLPSQNISDLQFSIKDSCLAMVGDGYVNRWKMVESFPKVSEGVVNRNTEYRSCAFLNDPMDEYKLMVVGSDGTKAIGKVFDQKDYVIQEVDGTETKMTQSTYIKTKNRIENVITGTDKGNIKVYNLPLSNNPFEDFNAHYGEVSNIIVSPDSRFVFTSGADGVVFVFAVTEYQDDRNVLKSGLEGEESKADDFMNMIVDSELADIVLVKKAEMDEWRKRQEQLKIEMEETNNKVEFKIQDLKFKYTQQMEELEVQKAKEIKNLEKRYEDLKSQKSSQEHENSQSMKKMELNHLQCVEELQNLYERKLYIENSNFLKLEQEKIEMKNLYEQKIKDLQRQNEDAIEKLLKEFTNNLQKVQVEYEDSKKTADGLKQMYEEKLTQQEDEHESEINDLKLKHQKKIEQLQATIGTLKSDIETNKRQQKRTEDEKKTEEDKRGKAQNKKNHYKKVLEEKLKQIALLEKEKQDLQAKLKTRETDLYRYKFKIKDLQKSKHVLTHRTTEMRASLEPKEHQIESLKDQLLNLEKVFEKQTNTMNKLEEEIQKKQSKNTQLSQELNIQKNLTKDKEKTIFKFINDVHKYVQMKDEKAYGQGLMQLNQDYVMPRSQELLEKKKKDPDTIEELDRQLRYMERSIATLKVNTIKNETRTKNDIKKRTKENTQLIHELNELRQENKRQKMEIKEIQNMNQKLKMELMKREKSGAEYGMSQSEQKFTSSMQQKTMPQMGRHDEESIPNMLHRPRSAVRQAGQPQKGKVYKGTPFDYRKGNLEDKARIAELTAQLEDNNQQILFQKIEIRTLKEQLIKILEERNTLLGEGGIGSQPYTPSSKQLILEMGGEEGYKFDDHRQLSSAQRQEQRPPTGGESGFLPKVDSRSNIQQ